VYIPLDFYTKQPRGIAFVQFGDPREVRARNTPNTFIVPPSHAPLTPLIHP